MDVIAQGSVKARGRGRPFADTTPDREEIMAISLRHFAADGYEGTSLRTIARDAGVDVATVSRLYGSKLELWKAVVDRLARQMAAMQEGIDTLWRVDLPAGARLETALRHYVRAHAEMPELLRFFADELARPGARRGHVIERLWQPHRAAFLPILRAAAGEGALVGNDPEMVLLMLVGAIGLPLALPMPDADAPVPVARLEEALVTLCLGGRRQTDRERERP